MSYHPEDPNHGWEEVPVTKKKKKKDTVTPQDLYDTVDEYIDAMDWELCEALSEMTNYRESECIDLLDRCELGEFIDFVTMFSISWPEKYSKSPTHDR